MKFIYLAFDRDDMSYKTIFSILIRISKIMMTRSVYKQGIYEIPNFLRRAIEKISASDVSLTDNIIR